MKASENAVNLIKHFEGLSLAAYPDPVSGGVPWTIGYGRAYGVKPGDVIDAATADDYLREDLERESEELSRLIKVPVTQNQFDALCSFAYNLGTTNLSKSTLLKMLNLMDPADAANEFVKWDMSCGKHINGLLNRRKAERDLFCRT